MFMNTTLFSKPIPLNSKGFTIIELMVALLISSIIMGAIATAYKSQQKSQTVLSQRIEMQQRLRSLMNFLSSEIRLAGLDPTEEKEFGIEAISAGSLQFTMDLDGDGDSDGNNEDIVYDFDDSDGDLINDDLDNDGEADAGFASFSRKRNNLAPPDDIFEPLAEDIVAVEFLSILEDTSDNDEYDPDTILTPTAAELDDIRAIAISILIRAKNPDSTYTNTKTYSTASGAIWGPYNDNYRRQLLITNVKLRNIGL